MNAFREIIGFVRRNRIAVILSVVIILVADIGIRALFGAKQPAVEAEETENSRNYDSGDTYEINRLGEKPQKRNLLPTILILAAAGSVGIYYAYKKGALNRLLPGFVLFRAVLLKQQTTERLLMQINIQNRSHVAITFLSPNVIFVKLLGNQRKFNIKNSTFPLTLTQGTSQILTFEIDRFQEKIPELKEYSFLKAEIKTAGGRVYKTFARPRWLISKYV